MSLSRHTVRCDADGCGIEVAGRVIAGKGAGTPYGWTELEDQHYCPAHEVYILITRAEPALCVSVDDPRAQLILVPRTHDDTGFWRAAGATGTRHPFDMPVTGD